MIEELLKEKDRKEACKMIDSRDQRNQASLEFHIDDILKYLESKSLIVSSPISSSIDDKLRIIKEWIFKHNMTELRSSSNQPFNLGSKIKLD